MKAFAILFGLAHLVVTSLAASLFLNTCLGANVVTAPTDSGGAQTYTGYPFITSSMRYQQVYNASLFSNLGKNIYLTQIIFPAPGAIWTVPEMQINLSTTTNSADHLSLTFSENVGADETVVFGPGGQRFPPNNAVGSYTITLDHSFRYDPAVGNLLMDVRVLKPAFVFSGNQGLGAFNDPRDEVSRVWSTNVQASTAEGNDTIGLTTYLLFSTDYHLTVPAPRVVETPTYFPFLIKQTYPSSNPKQAILSMRYQQVYSSSVFTNLDPSLMYITALTFIVESVKTNFSPILWSLTNMQVSLSTTTNSPGALSPIFGENIGADNVVVFNGSIQFQDNTPDARMTVYLDQPLRYDPARGNLLMDVQVSQVAGPNATDTFNYPWMAANNYSTGLVSRVWSTNRNSSVADGSDGLGLITLFQFSPVPSLRAEFFPRYFDGETNIIRIIWPGQPSVFGLQQTDNLGPRTAWRGVTNTVYGSPDDVWWILVPLSSANASAFYRLVWWGGE